VSRAQYLLSLHGIDALGETDTALAEEFLQQQLARREAIAEAHAEGDMPKLEALLEEARADITALEASLAERFEAPQDLDSARDVVRELRFLTKVASDIEAAISELEE
jgi:molecular chaperone HscB